jgi:rare lipoprotein A
MSRHTSLATVAATVLSFLITDASFARTLPESTAHAGTAHSHVGKTLPITDKTFRQVGRASWYGGPRQGHRTASGEAFDQREMTAAHRSLPFDSWVRVTNLENHRVVIVRINDRGPYSKGRVIDLSVRAAQELGMKRRGSARVRIESLPTMQLSSLDEVAAAR